MALAQIRGRLNMPVNRVNVGPICRFELCSGYLRYLEEGLG